MADNREYPHDVTLSVTFESPAVARAVQDAVAVEAGQIAGRRSRASVSRREATVRVTVRARDLTALRAGTTTWTALLDVADGIIQEIEATH